ncbi:hypothetical protein KL930_004221 [Ogataea haglerorum]|uniref:Tafazzin family protein n=1 Tax=Ogataea haglerorum TaxID=1937702 RepID=A0AAN6D2K3_9ASCO|nr:uncharacterized protein KL911_004289 [Ogataea haglerorum]KAG7692875.1 hypothetical protein KL915_004331 [Ogataea haglerorum]KAG7693940.1 hypothetical protein KL951_004419 [Ogataea haglerorum]KAG7704201.1 hypothetical protein KL914_004188 [Ogataea haglerorum]KAG7704386.1 hypothetical protein KL950_004193 [Ogataea haglerorum]KAG7725458.1 hypothetical protein KL933_004024 [Ogataea haglerorum]
MSFYDVLQRGDEFILKDRPAHSRIWNFFSQATCMAVVGGSKAILGLFYNVNVKGLDNLDHGLAKARAENRGFLTLMNHMSVCDDPFIWACLPWRYFISLDDIRWGLAASNICFNSKASSTFFSLGKLFACERFGRGPFQGGLDALVRILSPDDTLDTDHIFQGTEKSAPVASVLATDVRSFYSPRYTPPILRYKTSWVHIFPEGYVCQLKPPHNNSMRFFRWGTARLILEPTVAPVVVPIFSDGFEKIAPEAKVDDVVDSLLPQGIGSNITVNIGKVLDDRIIEAFRAEWRALCDKYHDKLHPNDLSFELKFGKEAEALRSRVCDYLREKVAQLRLENGFPPEDERLKSQKFWSEYTKTNGASAPDIEFVGYNWAVRAYQKNTKKYDEYGNEISK